ncbi:MAG: endo-1,4-beta-xylanase [Dysgonomonas sp.]|uniref:endo-1,4-beta-xylanase n=1 Tax=Dysgonomonas sp. TaxID=1891233 RepID=UPI003A892270
MKVLTPVLSLCIAFAIVSCSPHRKENEVKEPSLREAVKDKFLIGTALNTNQIWGKDTAAVKIVKEQFNSIVAENCMKSMYIQPVEGEFNFKDADKFVEFGEQNNMFITGHTLIWHSQAPDWFFRDDKGKDVSKEVLIERMRNHITTVVSRYKGRIKGWDVVNEAILDDGSWRDSKFYKIIGEDFIPLAFEFAHAADPEAELYYNDYNEWHAGKRDAIVKLVNSLKEKGLRIDGVGMQGHLGIDHPSLDEYRAAIDAYFSAGVEVLITELDVSALPSPRRDIGANIADTEAYRQEMNPYTTGLPDSISFAWNKRMGDLFTLFIDNSDKIGRVTLWGVTDGDSWKNDFPMPGRTDYPLLFDRRYKAKPIVKEIINKLKVKNEK